MADQTDQKLLAEWFWVDRWTGSSAFIMNMECRGLYREMLSQAWRRGAWLPNNHDAIRRATGCSNDEWDRCWPEIERYWTVTAGGKRLVNKTQQEVYAQALHKHQVASEKAQKAARARWDQDDSDAQDAAQADAQAMLEQCPPSPSPSPNSVTVPNSDSKETPPISPPLSPKKRGTSRSGSSRPRQLKEPHDYWCTNCRRTQMLTTTGKSQVKNWCDNCGQNSTFIKEVR